MNAVCQADIKFDPNDNAWINSTGRHIFRKDEKVEYTIWFAGVKTSGIIYQINDITGNVWSFTYDEFKKFFQTNPDIII